MQKYDSNLGQIYFMDENKFFIVQIDNRSLNGVWNDEHKFSFLDINSFSYFTKEAAFINLYLGKEA